MIWAAYAYDATILLAKAAADCKQGECLRDRLYATSDFEGVTGKTRFDSNGDVLSGLYEFKQVRDGRFEVIKD